MASGEVIDTMKLRRGLEILKRRLTEQGFRTTAWWAADHAARIFTGANIRRLSQITPQLHVGGQHRRHGMSRLKERGITAVVNMRIEFDDEAAGVSFERYLHLPTVDDEAPTLEDLHRGVAFISEETARNGAIYIHCGSGIGRAATMAAAYLVSTGLTPDEAWARIREIRPFVRPTPVQVEQLERFAAQIHQAAE
jgi:predicted protein tyrosine phosphatase